MYLKRSLAKHRPSVLMSLLWAAAGFLVFTLVATPVLFGTIVDLWRRGGENIVPLYVGLGGSLLGIALFMISARRFPYSNRYEVLISLSVVAVAAVLLFLAVTRSFYSGKVLCVFMAFQIVWFGLEMFYREKFVEYRFMVFPTRIKLAQEDFSEYGVVFIYDEREMADRLIDAVIVDDEDDLDEKWVERLAYCRSVRIPVIPLAVFLENIWGRIPLETLRRVFDMNYANPGPYIAVKAVLDRIFALIGILVLSPVMIVLAILVLLVSGRPVFCNQKRYGLNNRVFVMYKFRTMTTGGDVSRFGRMLRRYHLDELPQLFNVAKGDLSFVGPRPEMPKQAEAYRKSIPHYDRRTMINQGLMGWALIHQGNVAGIGDTAVKLSYDLYYIKHASALLDAYIVLKSIWLVIFGIEKVRNPGRLGLFAKEKAAE